MAIATLAYFGCLRSCELVSIKLEDVEKVTEGYMIRIIRTKTTNKHTRFLIPNAIANSNISPASIFPKYFEIVSPWLKEKNETRIWPRPTRSSFCLQFRGVNHVGTVAKRIATFFSLHPGQYTGHSFRRSSATSAADSGISLINLKRLGGWRSDFVASGYVDDSIASAVDAANHLSPLSSSIETLQNASTSICNQSFTSLSAITNADKSSPNTTLSDKKGTVVFNITINQQQ